MYEWTLRREQARSPRAHNSPLLVLATRTSANLAGSSRVVTSDRRELHRAEKIHATGRWITKGIIGQLQK